MEKTKLSSNSEVVIDHNEIAICSNYARLAYKTNEIMHHTLEAIDWFLSEGELVAALDNCFAEDNIRYLTQLSDINSEFLEYLKNNLNQK